MAKAIVTHPFITHLKHIQIFWPNQFQTSILAPNYFITAVVISEEWNLIKRYFGEYQ